MVFAQQIAKRLVGQLLQRLHGVAPQEMKRVPGLGIKFETFAHGRLGVHGTGTTEGSGRRKVSDCLADLFPGALSSTNPKGQLKALSYGADRLGPSLAQLTTLLCHGCSATVRPSLATSSDRAPSVVLRAYICRREASGGHKLEWRADTGPTTHCGARNCSYPGTSSDQIRQPRPLPQG